MRVILAKREKVGIGPERTGPSTLPALPGDRPSLRRDAARRARTAPEGGSVRRAPAMITLATVHATMIASATSAGTSSRPAHGAGRAGPALPSRSHASWMSVEITGRTAERASSSGVSRFLRGRLSVGPPNARTTTAVLQRDLELPAETDARDPRPRDVDDAQDVVQTDARGIRLRHAARKRTRRRPTARAAPTA